MAIEEVEKEQASWRESWSQACGVWKDRDDIDGYVADYRSEMDARIDAMQR